MSNQPTPYCLMPFIHFHVGNKGAVKACCVANIPFGNINEQSLAEIWEGKAINTLREKFKAGKADNRCAVCQNLEATGGKSIRQETFEKFGAVNLEPTPPLPIYFDIRFSNVCNFRCRTCWHGASSKWFNDAKKLGTSIGNKAIITNINEFNSFIDKMGEALLQAEEFYFAGGEPLVTEEHYLLLEWLVKNKATKARLRYNTNFSKTRFKHWNVINLWKHFPEVEVLASLDAADSLGEYIRKDMDWLEIIANRKKIRLLPQIKFKIAPTISVLNVEVLPAFYEECLLLNLIEPEDMYINILERPRYYNIQTLPRLTKDAVTEKYLRAMQPSVPLNIRKMFQEIMDYMYGAEGKFEERDEFLKKTAKLDELRDEENPTRNDLYLF